MAERFQRLFTLTPDLYSKGCPIIIEAGALLKDTESGAVLAQIKMRNIGEEVVSSCRISIKAFATNGDEVEGVSDFSYLDLNASRGREFGSKTPVILPDKTARIIAVDINEIVFSDGTVKKIDSKEWKTIPKRKTVEETLRDPELVKQYKIEAGANADFIPEKKDGLFLCACGAINLDSSEACYRCGNTFEFLNSRLDESYLSSKADERHNVEEAKKIKQQALKKKTIKIVAVACMAILLIVVAVKVAGTAKVNKMYDILAGNEYTLSNGYDNVRLDFNDNKTYTLSDDKGSKTVEYVIVKDENGDGYEINKKGGDWYDGDMLYINHFDGNQIKEIWSETYLDNLTKTSDTNNKSTDTKTSEVDNNEQQYKEAISLLDSGDYKEAQKIFIKLGDYKDSKKQIENCKIMRADDYYNSGEYGDALIIYKEYSDNPNVTDEKINQCKEAIYQDGLKYFEDGDYTSAWVEFDKISEYKDSEDYIDRCLDADN